MNRITKALLALVILATLLVGLALAFQKPLATWVLQKMVERNAGISVSASPTTLPPKRAEISAKR